MIKDIEQKLDKIIVKEKEFKNIMRWAGGKNPTEMFDKRMFFPLKNFIIDIQLDKHTTFKGLVELDSFNPATAGRISNDAFWFKYTRDPHRGYQFDGQGCPKDVVRVTFGFVSAVLFYICTREREVVWRDRIESIKKDGGYEPYKYQSRVCFLLDDIIKYTGTHNNRKAVQYTCDVWGVRGHIRHYKNGDTVFIEPYKKGRKRDVLEPKSKTYLLEDAK